MSLKQMMLEDIETVFLDPDEFAALHTIDGEENILCVIDDDKSSKTNTDGVYVIRRRLFIKQSDLGYRPIPEQMMNIDGENFYVVDVIGDGLIEVVLEANRS